MGMDSSVQKYLLSMHVTYHWIHPYYYLIKYTAGLYIYCLLVWVSIRYGMDNSSTSVCLLIVVRGASTTKVISRPVALLLSIDMGIPIPLDLHTHGAPQVNICPSGDQGLSGSQVLLR